MKIKNAFRKNFNLQRKIKSLRPKKFAYYFKIAFSRLYTTGWLGIISLISLLVILNDNFSFLMFESTTRYQIQLYHFFLNIAMGVFISFIFYFIVVHVEKESKKSSIYLYLNNSLSDLENKIHLLLFSLDQDTNLKIGSLRNDPENVIKIFQNAYQNKNYRAIQEILHTSHYLNKKIDEILALNSIIDSTIIRRLSQIKGYPLSQLISHIEKNVTSNEVPGTNASRYMIEIMENIKKLLIYFYDEYSIYHFEYNNDYKEK